MGDWLGTGAIAPQLRQYRSFEKARAFVQSLSLKSRTEWNAYSKGQMPQLGILPADIPATPERTYHDKGWSSVGDWLETGAIASFLREYRSFEKARAFVQSLGLKSRAEWNAYRKGQMPHLGELPADIPAKPDYTYQDKGWSGMGDWLGTGAIASFLRKYRSFEKARAFVQSLGLKSGAEWSAYCKGQMPQLGELPADIPRAPEQKYNDKGWSSWGEQLGTGLIANYLIEYRSFENARAFVQSLGLKSTTEWNAYSRGQMPQLGELPADIPAKPRRTYHDKGWSSMGDWLGTGVIAPNLKEYRSFEKARAFVQSLGLKSRSEWNAYTRGQMPQHGILPVDIPATPDKTYKDKGWSGIGDWLGTGSIAPRLREFRSFEKARAFVQSLDLNSRNEWNDYCKGLMPHLEKLPADIPTNPDKAYKDKGWSGIGDWLGTGSIAPQHREFRSFREARAFASGLNLNTQKEWYAFCRGEMPEMGRLPADIPSNPQRSYADTGWIGFGDWLETGIIATRLKEYRSFDEARAFVRNLKLKSRTEWRAFCEGRIPQLGNLPADIPRYPNQVYAAKGWNSLGDWLGTGRTRVSKSPKRKT